MTERERICDRFGRYVRRERAWVGMTQKQLAEHVSLHQPQVSRMERGEFCPRLDAVVRILAVLGADPRELLEALD